MPGPIAQNADIRYLGKLLGDVIRAYGGDALFERIEFIRSSSVDRYRGIAGAAAVDRGLDALSLDDTLAFVRGVLSSCPTALAIWALLATMMILRTPPVFICASLAGISTLPAISAGISTVKITNDRERTRSRYSRWISVQTLCIFAHQVDKDFFQRRLQ